jgi:hypothetical protein
MQRWRGGTLKNRLLATLTALSVLTSLAIGAPASASAARASKYTNRVCITGVDRFVYTIYWSNTTNHRVSIDEVFVASATHNGSYVNLTDVEVLVERPNGSDVHDNRVENLGRSSADFYWPQSWITASSSTDAAGVYLIVSNEKMSAFASCLQQSYFWG